MNKLILILLSNFKNLIKKFNFSFLLVILKVKNNKYLALVTDDVLFFYRKVKIFPVIKKQVNESRLNFVLLTMFFGVIFAVLFHYVHWQAVPGPNGYTRIYKESFFLPNPVTMFSDFFSLADQWWRLRWNINFNYLPAAIIPLSLLEDIGRAMYGYPNPYVTAFIFVYSYIVFLGFYLYYSFISLDILKRFIIILALAICSYPVLLTLHTSNFESHCFIMIAIAFYLFIKRSHFWSAIFIGFSASIKIYPLFFIVVIINRKNFWNVVTGSILGFVSLNFLALNIRGDFVSNITTWSTGFMDGMNSYSVTMIQGWSGIPFSHSLLNAYRLIIGPNNIMFNPYPYYYIFAALVLFFIIYRIIRMKNISHKFILAASALCLLPVTSTDYKLMYFLIPIIILIKSSRKNWVDSFLLGSMTLLMIPKGYYFVHKVLFGYPGGQYFYFNSNTIINAAILILLIAVTIWASYNEKLKSKSAR